MGQSGVRMARFVTVLRMWAAFLAGTHHMHWTRFLFYNALGGILWATSYGLGGYLLGNNIHWLTGPVGVIVVVVATMITLAFVLFLRRNEQRLAEQAERAFPGPLE